MEKTKTVWLNNKFEIIWESLSKVENGVELETGEYKTRFIAKAVMAKRNGKVAVQALVFLKSCENGKLKECSRCYAPMIGCYFNHFGTDGQRIGLYLKSLDEWMLKP